MIVVRLIKPGGSWFKSSMDVYGSSYDVALDFSDLGTVVENVLADKNEMRRRQKVRFEAVKPFMRGYNNALDEQRVVGTMKSLLQNFNTIITSNIVIF